MGRSCSRSKNTKLTNERLGWLVVCETPGQMKQFGSLVDGFSYLSLDPFLRVLVLVVIFGVRNTFNFIYHI